MTHFSYRFPINFSFLLKAVTISTGDRTVIQAIPRVYTV